MPRGRGERCAGFVVESGHTVFCTREDRAGPLPLDRSTEPPAYPHRATGACDCGVIHLGSTARAAPARLRASALPASGQRTIAATYPYVDSEGRELFEVVRFTPKGFSQRRRGEDGEWIWNLEGVERPPYRLPQVLASSGLVVVVEGERDADALWGAGVPATTCPGGAGRWRVRQAEWLAGREVAVIPDNDEPGRQSAESTAAILVRAGAALVRVVPLPDLPEHGDVSDFLESGRSLADLAALIAVTQPYRTGPPPTNGSGNGSGPPSDEPPRPEPMPGLGLYSDTRNAARLVARHGADLRFDFTRGYWRIWDGVRWKLDETDQIMRAAKAVVVAMHEELADLDGEQAAKLRRVILAVESTGRLRAMIDNARSSLSSTHETWDPDPWLLNCANGTVDLRSGELLAHDPGFWQSKVCAVAYAPDATCPVWLTFLERIFGGDLELIAFLQRAIGLALVGAVVEHVLFVLWGVGANGKSAALGTVLGMLGDYGRQASPDLFIERETPQHTTNIAELRGVRFVSAIETSGGGRLSEVLVKVLTGGDQRNARFMHQDSFTYVPSDTFFLATNHKPVPRDNGPALWRRIRLIPFRVEIPEGEQDAELPTKLRAEWAGILAWAVRGCLDWRAHGLGTPAAVRIATDSYRDAADALGNFLDDRCVVDPRASAPATPLYETYQSWCQENGEKPASQRFFGLRLGDRGFVKSRYGKGGRKLWVGLRLLDENDLPGLDEPFESGPGGPLEGTVDPWADPGAGKGQPENDDPYTLSLSTDPYDPYKKIERESKKEIMKEKGEEEKITGGNMGNGLYGSAGQPSVSRPPDAAPDSPTIINPGPHPQRSSYPDAASFDDASESWARAMRRWADQQAGTPSPEDP